MSFKKRGFRVAQELNISIDRIISFLEEHEHDNAIQGSGLTMKIVDEEAYLMLQKEYSDDPEAAARLREMREEGRQGNNHVSESGLINSKDAPDGEITNDGSSGNTEAETDDTGKVDKEFEKLFSLEHESITNIDRGDYLSKAEVREKSNDEKMEYLLEAWGIDKPVLRGVLEELSDGRIWLLKDAHTRSGTEVKYPVKGLKNARARWIFAGFKLSYNHGELVEAEFEITDDARSLKLNPLSIKLVEKTIRPVQTLPLDAVQVMDGSVVIPKTVYQHYLDERREEAETEVRKRLDSIKAKIEEKEQELEEAREKVQKIESKSEDAIESQEAARKRAEELEQKADDLEERKGELYRELNTTRQEVNDQIVAINREAQEQKDRLMNEVQKLRTYITQRADQLNRLDLISDEQRENLIDTSPSEQAGENALIFSDDLDGNFNRLVDHMQAYLLDDGILYPRFLLEDFLTLLRTHDLVVLSGLSGSGKTQLVHSFAEAVDGKAHVIPVKPNWTSSEDLLGYYNPLQKSYLSTPFLDALIEAKRNPEQLHLICLDEMNLARVEYYFADFLSKLEERKVTPELPLYSTEEAGHVEAEVRALMDVIDEAENQNNEEVHEHFGELLRDEEVSELLQQRLGIENGKSFVELHAHIRRMIAGVLNVPAKLSLPENVRFIGAINMDQTTNTLATKVLDRAHVMRFESPMTYDWEAIQEESEASDAEPVSVHLPAAQFTPERKSYPKYQPGEDDIADQLVEWTNEYLRPIGIDIGLRTIRQAINYRNLLRQVHSGEEDELYARSLNSILLRKVLPRFSFEGKRPVSNSESDDTRHDRVQNFRNAVRKELSNLNEEAAMPHAARELDRLINAAEQSGATIYNYWN